jgi:hypothetical protein
VKRLLLTRIVRAITLKNHALRWGFLFTAGVLATAGIAPDRASLSGVRSGSAQSDHAS